MSRLPRDAAMVSARVPDTGLPGGARAPMDPADLAPADIVAYLRAHPDFLVEHPELALVLTPPERRQGDDSVLDIQRFMLDRLRREIDRLKDQQAHIVTTSRANLMTQTRVHSAVVSLLEARGFEHLLHILTTDLAILLDLDVVSLCVEPSQGAVSHFMSHGVRVLAPGTIDAWVGHRDVVLSDDIDGAPEIFGVAAGLVRSQALVRLEGANSAPVMLLAFGSRSPDKFHPGQGIELLAFQAQVIRQCLRNWLDIDA